MSCFHKIILTARDKPNIGSRAAQGNENISILQMTLLSSLSLIPPHVRQLQL